MTDDLLADLRGENTRAFGQLYKAYFGPVSRLVIRYHGHEEDAEDVFQETMLVLVAKLRKDNFRLTASMKTYIMAIAKHIWFNQLRAKARQQDLSSANPDNAWEEIQLAIEQEKTYWDHLQYYLYQITDRCQELIQDIFFRGKNMDQIREEYGYSTLHNAQNQKYKCIEQIKKVKEQARAKGKP